MDTQADVGEKKVMELSARERTRATLGDEEGVE